MVGAGILAQILDSPTGKNDRNSIQSLQSRPWDPPTLLVHVLGRLKMLFTVATTKIGTEAILVEVFLNSRQRDQNVFQVRDEWGNVWRH